MDNSRTGAIEKIQIDINISPKKLSQFITIYLEDQIPHLGMFKELILLWLSSDQTRYQNSLERRASHQTML